MIFFVLVAIFRVVTLVFYAAYDMRCIIFEQASVVSCQQDALIPHEYAVIVTLAWLLSSVFGSAVFLLVILCYRKVFNFQCYKAKNMRKKGSFLSLAFLLLTAIAYHGYRTSLVSSDIGTAISVSLVFWMLFMFCVLCCLNYTPRVQWKSCYKNVANAVVKTFAAIFTGFPLLRFFWKRRTCGSLSPLTWHMKWHH